MTDHEPYSDPGFLAVLADAIRHSWNDGGVTGRLAVLGLGLSIAAIPALPLIAWWF